MTGAVVGLAEFLGEDWVVNNLIWIWNLDLIVWNLFELASDHVELLELEPAAAASVEDDVVLEMQRTNIKRPILLIHKASVNLDLLKQFAIILVVVELEGLDEIV